MAFSKLHTPLGSGATCSRAARGPVCWAPPQVPSLASSRAHLPCRASALSSGNSSSSICSSSSSFSSSAAPHEAFSSSSTISSSGAAAACRSALLASSSSSGGNGSGGAFGAAAAWRAAGRRRSGGLGVRRRATVYHEVSVPLVEPGDDDDAVPMREPPTRVTANGRIIAIGDLHGDMDKALASLKLARVIAEDDDGSAPKWTGGDAVVVQLGDVLDRGNVEIGILKLLIDLDAQAQKDGGAVYMLNGNHESLNVCGDFRYVTPGAFIESAVEFGIPRDQALRSWDGCIQARAALFLPGGRVARMLSRNPTVLVVNDTAFAHGGLLPTHTQYGVERMNAEVAAWMRRDRTEDGFASPPFLAMGDGKSVMWNRQLSVEKWPSPVERYRATSMVSQALEAVGAKRLVVGHTPQMGGANVDCEGLVWRIDVGMSSGVLDAPVSILEITAGADGAAQCRVVTEGEQLASFDEQDALVDV